MNYSWIVKGAIYAALHFLVAGRLGGVDVHRVRYDSRGSSSSQLSLTLWSCSGNP